MTENRTCTIDGCERRHSVGGLCDTHYRQARSGKTPGPIRTPAVDRVLEIVNMEPTGGCVLWPSGSGRSRPMFTTQGKRASVARTVLALTAGPPPTPEHDALHAPLICHEPRCVAPWHLRWGTHSENMADMWLDGTMPGVKLTEGEVRAIRRDSRDQQAIASDYGIHQSTVSKIKRQKQWRDLPPT